MIRDLIYVVVVMSAAGFLSATPVALAQLPSVESRNDSYAALDSLLSLAERALAHDSFSVAEARINEAELAGERDARIDALRLSIWKQSGSLDGKDERRRQVMAGRVLQSDPPNAVANFVLGDLYASRYVRASRLLSDKYSPQTRRRVESNLTNAWLHLSRSIEEDPDDVGSYRSMVEFLVRSNQSDRLVAVADLMRYHLPYEESTWLYSGLAYARIGSFEEAGRFFDRALVMMRPEDADVFRYPEFLLDSDQRLRARADAHGFWTSFWSAREPRFMSAANERLIAHYERIVSCDLLYPGWRDASFDGWIITPPTAILRYGMPRYQGHSLAGDGRSRTLSFGYPDAHFLFTDWTRSGHYQVIDDGALRSARARIASVPDSFYAPPDLDDIPITFVVARLRSADDGTSGVDEGETLLVAAGAPVGIGESGEPGTPGSTLTAVRVGVFVLDSTRTVVGQKTRSFYGLPASGYINTAEGQLWCTAVEVAHPPGATSLSVEMELGERAVGVRRADVAARVGAGSGAATGAMTISDIVVAHLVTDTSDETARSTCAIRRFGFNIRPAPTLLTTQTAPIYVYWETYGLRLDEQGEGRVSIEVAVRPADTQAGGLRSLVERLLNRDRTDGVSTRVERTATEATFGDYMIVDLGDLEPGDYAIALRVTDLFSGEIAESVRRIFIR